MLKIGNRILLLRLLRETSSNTRTHVRAYAHIVRAYAARQRRWLYYYITSEMLSIQALRERSGRLYSDQHAVQQPDRTLSLIGLFILAIPDRYLRDSVVSVGESWDRSAVSL